MKRTLSFLMALILCFSLAASIGAAASAAISWPSMSKTQYCEFTSDHTTPNYRYSDFSVRGTNAPAKSYNSYSEAGDIVKIISIKGNVVLYMFPTSGHTGGYKTAYCKLSDLFGTKSAPVNYVKSKGSANTYITPNGTKYGYTEANDGVWVTNVVKSGHTLIVYQAKSGSRAYKAGFVRNSDLSSKIIGTTTPSTKAQTLASVALNEVGYHGTKKDGTGTGDYTKYGKWMNMNGVYWCAEFVSWCANRAGVSTSVVPKSASTLTMAQKSNSYVKWSSSTLNNLKQGDVIFFSHTKKSLTTSDGAKSVYHVGIVYSVNTAKNTITIIEGNTSSDYVKKNTYTVNPSTGWFSSGSWFCGYISVK